MARKYLVNLDDFQRVGIDLLDLRALMRPINMKLG